MTYVYYVLRYANDYYVDDDDKELIVTKSPSKRAN